MIRFVSLWPEGGFEDRFRVFLSDDAAYTLKVATALKVLYPHRIDITYGARGL
jgi:hypothetical protein